MELNEQQWSGFRRPFRGNPQQGTLMDVRQIERAPDTSPGAQRMARRRAMVEAMPQTWAGMTTPEHVAARTKAASRHFPPGSGRGGEPIGRVFGEGTLNAVNALASDSAGRQIRAEMGQRLAEETTVQPEHLEGLTQIDVGQSQTPSGGLLPEFGNPNVAARYQIGPKRIQAPREMSTGALTHEIGHHVSIFHERNPPGERTRNRQGLDVDLAEEGRADAFALEHAGEKRDFTYASNDRHGTGKFEHFTSPYRKAREAAGQPLRDWELTEPQPPRPVESSGEWEQSEVIKTDRRRITAPYLGVDMGVNIYRPSPVLDRGNRPIGFEVRPGESRGLYEVEGGGHLDPQETGYYWKRRGPGDERMAPHYLTEDGVTLDTIDEERRAE